ncbi:unnamed protein product [Paramecium sonneborni]|uniref:Uncharacterized protein n=1 Tax=Paramecium sonneborni TaxID=65129 RepID=A0A8S1PXN6_9CILI|nr:unnamed protein product [Paramecium sonneborni]
MVNWPLRLQTVNYLLQLLQPMDNCHKLQLLLMDNCHPLPMIRLLLLLNNILQDGNRFIHPLQKMFNRYNFNNHNQIFNNQGKVQNMHDINT